MESPDLPLLGWDFFDVGDVFVQMQSNPKIEETMIRRILKRLEFYYSLTNEQKEITTKLDLLKLLIRVYYARLDLEYEGLDVCKTNVKKEYTKENAALKKDSAGYKEKKRELDRKYRGTGRFITILRVFWNDPEMQKIRVRPMIEVAGEKETKGEGQMETGEEKEGEGQMETGEEKEGEGQMETGEEKEGEGQMEIIPKKETGGIEIFNEPDDETDLETMIVTSKGEMMKIEGEEKEEGEMMKIEGEEKEEGKKNISKILSSLYDSLKMLPGVEILNTKKDKRSRLESDLKKLEEMDEEISLNFQAAIESKNAAENFIKEHEPSFHADLELVGEKQIEIDVSEDVSQTKMEEVRERIDSEIMNEINKKRAELHDTETNLNNLSSKHRKIEIEKRYKNNAIDSMTIEIYEMLSKMLMLYKTNAHKIYEEKGKRDEIIDNIDEQIIEEGKKHDKDSDKKIQSLNKKKNEVERELTLLDKMEDELQVKRTQLKKVFYKESKRRVNIEIEYSANDAYLQLSELYNELLEDKYILLNRLTVYKAWFPDKLEGDKLIPMNKQAKIDFAKRVREKYEDVLETITTGGEVEEQDREIINIIDKENFYPFPSNQDHQDIVEIGLRRCVGKNIMLRLPKWEGVPTKAQIAVLSTNIHLILNWIDENKGSVNEIEQKCATYLDAWLSFYIGRVSREFSSKEFVLNIICKHQTGKTVPDASKLDESTFRTILKSWAESAWNTAHSQLLEAIDNDLKSKLGGHLDNVRVGRVMLQLQEYVYLESIGMDKKNIPEVIFKVPRTEFTRKHKRLILESPKLLEKIGMISSNDPANLIVKYFELAIVEYFREEEKETEAGIEEQNVKDTEVPKETKRDKSFVDTRDYAQNWYFMSDSEEEETKEGETKEEETSSSDDEDFEYLEEVLAGKRSNVRVKSTKISRRTFQKGTDVKLKYITDVLSDIFSIMMKIVIRVMNTTPSGSEIPVFHYFPNWWNYWLKNWKVEGLDSLVGSIEEKLRPTQTNIDIGIGTRFIDLLGYNVGLIRGLLVIRHFEQKAGIGELTNNAWFLHAFVLLTINQYKEQIRAEYDAMADLVRKSQQKMEQSFMDQKEADIAYLGRLNKKYVKSIGRDKKIPTDELADTPQNKTFAKILDFTARFSKTEFDSLMRGFPDISNIAVTYLEDSEIQYLGKQFQDVCKNTPLLTPGFYFIPNKQWEKTMKRFVQYSSSRIRGRIFNQRTFASQPWFANLATSDHIESLNNLISITNGFWEMLDDVYDEAECINVLFISGSPRIEWKKLVREEEEFKLHKISPLFGREDEIRIPTGWKKLTRIVKLVKSVLRIAMFAPPANELRLNRVRMLLPNVNIPEVWQQKIGEGEEQQEMEVTSDVMSTSWSRTTRKSSNLYYIGVKEQSPWYRSDKEKKLMKRRLLNINTTIFPRTFDVGGSTELGEELGQEGGEELGQEGGEESDLESWAEWNKEFVLERVPYYQFPYQGFRLQPMNAFIASTSEMMPEWIDWLNPYREVPVNYTVDPIIEDSISNRDMVDFLLCFYYMDPFLCIHRIAEALAMLTVRNHIGVADAHYFIEIVYRILLTGERTGFTTDPNINVMKRFHALLQDTFLITRLYEVILQYLDVNSDLVKYIDYFRPIYIDEVDYSILQFSIYELAKRDVDSVLYLLFVANERVKYQIDAGIRKINVTTPFYWSIHFPQLIGFAIECLGFLANAEDEYLTMMFRTTINDNGPISSLRFCMHAMRLLNPSFSSEINSMFLAEMITKLFGEKLIGSPEKRIEYDTETIHSSLNCSFPGYSDRLIQFEIHESPEYKTNTRFMTTIEREDGTTREVDLFYDMTSSNQQANKLIELINKNPGGIEPFINNMDDDTFIQFLFSKTYDVFYSMPTFFVFALPRIMKYFELICKRIVEYLQKTDQWDDDLSVVMKYIKKEGEIPRGFSLRFAEEEKLERSTYTQFKFIYEKDSLENNFLHCLFTEMEKGQDIMPILKIISNFFKRSHMIGFLTHKNIDDVTPLDIYFSKDHLTHEMTLFISFLLEFKRIRIRGMVTPFHLLFRWVKKFKRDVDGINIISDLWNRLDEERDGKIEDYPLSLEMQEPPTPYPDVFSWDQFPSTKHGRFYRWLQIQNYLGHRAMILLHRFYPTEQEEFAKAREDAEIFKQTQIVEQKEGEMQIVEPKEGETQIVEPGRRADANC